MKKILLTGGAGYIGSLCTRELLEKGYAVTVLDDLSKGDKKYIDKRATFYKIDILDLKKLRDKLKDEEYDVVMHFAALKDASESMKNPHLYQNNIIGTMNMLKLTKMVNAKQFIFSSSAAVYGDPKSKTINEDHIKDPNNFYGYTKLSCEELLSWQHKIDGTNYIALRYFNVSGDGGLSYIDKKASNVFAILADCIKNKKLFKVYGGDYDTKDGTCVRDYVHVADIVDAHIKAIGIKGAHSINLGSERGYSVLEIIKEFENISGEKLNYKIVSRRVGDISRSVASSSKAHKILTWKIKHNLFDMVESTLSCYNKNMKMQNTKVIKKVAKVTPVKKSIMHVTDDIKHLKKEFAVKHPPNLKPKSKFAK